MMETNRYLLLFENNLDAVLVSKIDGTTVGANPAACKMFQMTEAELCAAGRAGILDCSDPKVEVLLAERVTIGKTRGDVTFKRKDGSTFTADLTSFTAGNDGYSLVIIRDMTKQKATEEALEKTTLFSEKIASAIPDVLYITDVHSLDTVYVTSVVQEILGYEAQEITAMGGDLVQLVHPDDLISVLSKVELLKKAPDGEIVETVFRMKHKDGAYRWLRARDVAILRDSANNVQQYLGTARDITEQKRLEGDLQSDWQTPNSYRD